LNILLFDQCITRSREYETLQEQDPDGRESRQVAAGRGGIEYHQLSDFTPKSIPEFADPTMKPRARLQRGLFLEEPDHKQCRRKLSANVKEND
jgi:hypothetical protein